MNSNEAELRQAIQNLIDYEGDVILNENINENTIQFEPSGLKSLIGVVIFVVLFNGFSVVSTGFLATKGSNYFLLILILVLVIYIMWQKIDCDKHNSKIITERNIRKSKRELYVKDINRIMGNSENNQWWNKLDIYENYIVKRAFPSAILEMTVDSITTANDKGQLYLTNITNTFKKMSYEETIKLISNPNFRRLPSKTEYNPNGNYGYSNLYLHSCEPIDVDEGRGSGYDHMYILVGKMILKDGMPWDILIYKGEAPYDAIVARKWQLGEQCLISWKSKLDLTTTYHLPATFRGLMGYKLPPMDYTMPKPDDLTDEEWIAWIMAHLCNQV